MPGEVWTIKKVLDFASDYFNKARIENPHLEAEILLAKALNAKRIDLYINFEKVMSADELARFKEYIKRRKDHEPSAYIIGTKSFMSLDLAVTKSVLIPRPETELIVESALSLLKGLDRPSVLDIGTGSGAIAVSLAKYLPTAKIAATDTSEKALEVAAQNASANGVSDRIRFETADLFPKSGEKFDLMVSNPPYIRTKDIEALPPEVKDHEPLSALDGGEDGMKYYGPIISGAKERLKENGHLILEIDPGLTLQISSMLKGSGYAGIDVRRDLNGCERAVIAG